MKKIDRKSFLKNISLATVGVLGSSHLLSGCKSDEEMKKQREKGPNIITNKKIRWKMVTTWPPNFPILGEGCNMMANWVKEMSNGQLDIRVYGGGELVPPLEVFDAVSSGVAAIGNSAAYYWAGKITAAPFFGAVPFGMNAQQQNAWLKGGNGMKLWREIYAPHNLLPFPSGNTGVQMGGWFNKEINTIDDFKGLKMRIPGLGGRVLEKAGGTPILSPGGEIYINLERGVIDATEWVGPFHDYKMGFHKVAKFYYYPGWHEPGSTLETIINRQKMEKLPKYLQEILKTAIERQNNWTLAAFDTQNSIYLDKIIKETDVQIKAFPKTVLDQLKIHTKTVLDELTANDSQSKKVYLDYERFRNKAISWSNLTEKIYYDSIG